MLNSIIFFSQGSWITSPTVVVMAISVLNHVGASAVKAGQGKTALNPSAPWAVQAGVCVLMASASVTVIIAGKTAQRPAAQLTAAPADSAWMENASVRKGLQEKTAAS